MRHIRGALLFALSLLVAACGQGRAGKESRWKEMSVPVAGGPALPASYYPSLDPNAPALLLLHGENGRREDWILFAMRAQQAGFACLAPDFAWQADKPDSDTISMQIGSAFEFLRHYGLPAKRIALVGASLGGNLALRYAAAHPEVEVVAMVSPGLNFGGVDAEKELAQYGRGAIFFVSAAGDAYSADSARRLQGQAKGFAELREYPGAAHGTDLFTVSENSAAQLLDWLKLVLSEKAAKRGV